MAISNLSSGKDIEFTFRLFEENYKAGDFDMLWNFALDNLESMDIEMTIIDLRHIAQKSRSRKVIDFFKWSYDASPCPDCRRFTVDDLQKLKALPTEWREEMLLDANESIRETAETMR